MPVLEVHDLRKSYRTFHAGQVTVVDVPRFSLEQGQQVALRGASGSGKTTFLNLVAGILKADAGRILIHGQEMTALGEDGRDRLRGRRIGYVFQTFNLLQGYSVLENVLLAMAFGGGIDHGRAVEILRRVGLGDRLTYRPRELSVGQQQRVAVARALVNRPGIVLADEPTGNLDRPNAQAAITLIREICEENQAALLLVSHDAFVLDQFSQVQDMARLNRTASIENGLESMASPLAQTPGEAGQHR